MNYAEKEVARHYHNQKSHISIYPVIVNATFENGHQIDVPYKINLKSAFTDGHGWRWQQIFTGEDEGRPLKNWDDVIFLAELELKKLATIIEPLLYDDIQKAYNAWSEINGKMTYLEMKLQYEASKVDALLGVKFRMMAFDPDDDPRMKVAHWLPIWGAWKHFLEVFKKDLSENRYVKM